MTITFSKRRTNLYLHISSVTRLTTPWAWFWKNSQRLNVIFDKSCYITADWSLGGHLSIWSPDMWLRVSMCGVDEVDNHQPWHRSTTRASSQSTQSSDHTFYHLDSALFLIEIICQFRHIKFLIKNKQVSIP